MHLNQGFWKRSAFARGVPDDGSARHVDTPSCLRTRPVHHAAPTRSSQAASTAIGCALSVIRVHSHPQNAASGHGSSTRWDRSRIMDERCAKPEPLATARTIRIQQGLSGHGLLIRGQASIVGRLPCAKPAQASNVTTDALPRLDRERLRPKRPDHSPFAVCRGTSACAPEMGDVQVFGDGDPSRSKGANRIRKGIVSFITCRFPERTRLKMLPRRRRDTIDCSPEGHQPGVAHLSRRSATRLYRHGGSKRGCWFVLPGRGSGYRVIAAGTSRATSLQRSARFHLDDDGWTEMRLKDCRASFLPRAWARGPSLPPLKTCSLTMAPASCLDGRG